MSAVATDTRSEKIQTRVPQDVHRTITEMAKAENTSISEIVTALLVKALLDGADPGVAPVSGEDVLERAFCLALARLGDTSEVIQLQETAKFRGETIMQTVFNHVRWGIREGSLFA